MNHKIANLKLRGTALVALGGLVASGMFACGGDSTSAGDDGGGGGDAPAEADSSPTRDSAPDTRTGGDSATMTDGPAGDTSTDSTVPSDSGIDAADGAVARDTGNAPDSGADVTMVDAADAAADAADAAPAPLPPLNLCSVLDTDWGLTTFDYNTRATTWGQDISEASNPQSFAAALTNDCALHGLQGFLSGNAAIADYLSQLDAFTLQFFGCGLSDAGALSFSALIPTMAQGHTFTVADLNELAKLYVNSTNAEASLQWAGQFATNGTPPSPEPLTVDQINQIEAQLASLQAAMPGVNPSTTHLTLSTCDAGTDAGGDAAGDAGGDAADDTGDGGTDAGGG